MRFRFRAFPEAFPLLSALLLLSRPASAADKLKILTTTLPVYSLAATVAGDSAEIENLLPPGVEPHDYQMGSREIGKIRGAGLILLSGLRLEDWLERFLAAPGIQSRVVVVSRNFDSDAIYGATPLGGWPVRSPSGGSGESGQFGNLGRPESLRGGSSIGHAPNPHFWLDPVLAARAVTNILAALSLADPPRAPAFASNAAKLGRELAQLDAAYSRGLQPLRGIPFITSHDFFAYPARRYQLRLVGLLETDPEVEPSIRHVVDLGAVIRREKVGVIFVEPRFRSRLAGQLCLDYSLVQRELDPIETGPLTAGAYLAAMRQNLRSLEEGLRGAKN